MSRTQDGVRRKEWDGGSREKTRWGWGRGCGGGERKRKRGINEGGKE